MTGPCALLLDWPEPSVLLTDRTWITFARLDCTTHRVWLFPSPAAAAAERQHAWPKVKGHVHIVPLRGTREDF